MKKFEYTRYWKCDICGATYGSTEVTKLSIHSQIPTDAFPTTWTNIQNNRFHVCDKHKIVIDDVEIK